MSAAIMASSPAQVPIQTPARDESGDGADGSTGPMLDGGDAVDGVCVTVPSCGGGGGGGGGGAGFIYAPVFPGGQIDPPSANP
jgi:hypothetical protein